MRNDSQTTVQSTSVRNTADLLKLLNEINAKENNLKIEYTSELLHKYADCEITSDNYEVLGVRSRNGIVNQIFIPAGELKIILSDIKKLLDGIDSKGSSKCERLGTVVDNAKLHIGQNYMYKVFLKGYYETTDRNRICKRLQESPFKFDFATAWMIACTCCTNICDDTNSQKEPQYVVANGASTSRILADITRDNLDRKMRGVAKRFRLRYSRYRNELIFSSKHNVYQSGGEFEKEIERIITAQKYELDREKSCLQKKGKHTELKGLVISDKVNVKRQYIKNIKSLLHIIEKYGEEALGSSSDRSWKNVIKGKLNYLKTVKGEEDSVYLKLKAQYEKVYN